MEEASTKTSRSVGADPEGGSAYLATPPRESVKPVSMVDVARVCGCSITTVSLVMNGVAGARISKQTRDRVQDALRRLNYAPNRMAKGLASRKTWTVALVSEYDSQYPIAVAQLEIIAGIQSVLSPTEYDLLLVHRHKGPVLARSRGADGFILLSPLSMQEIQPFIDGDLPAMVMESSFPVPLPTVGMDETQAVHMAVEHLLSMGHRRIGYLGIGQHPSCMGLRSKAYLACMQTHHLDPMEDLFFTDYNLGEVLQLLPMIVRTRGMTAISCMTDSLAIRAMTCLQKAGLHVPRDVSVVGINGSPASQTCNPPLTTVYNPLLERSTRAVQMLLDRIEHDNRAVEHITFDASLIVRDSTAAPAGK